MKQQVMTVLAVGVLSVGGTVAVGSVGQRTATTEGPGGRHMATVRLADGRAVGTVRFQRDRDGTRVNVALRMPVDLAGATFHGFHVHANSDPANGSGCVADPAAPPSTWFVSADGHLSEPGATHGDHTGDLPVVYVQEGGEARATFVTDRFEPRDVVGRAVIVHALPDNYGNIPASGYTPVGPAAVDLTARTGNAGDRIACGVVQP